jgi:putative nucleotidyltransferase with HDIG domain
MNPAAWILPNQREIRYRIGRISGLPPLIGALQQLLDLINSESASAKELEHIILYDPALSAKILRVANSSFYGSRGNVPTVARAIMLMGFDQVKSICLSTLMMKLCSDESALPPGQRERLWKHAFATARIASQIAQSKPLISKELAYVLGFLHDIGRMALAVHFNDYYRKVTSLAETQNIPPWFVEYESGLTHTEIGRYMCTKCALPEIFKRITEFHHQPHHSPSHTTEVTLVFLADVLANFGQFPEYAIDPFTLSCTQKLCLTQEEWKHCIKRSSAVWPQVDAFWALLK